MGKSTISMAIFNSYVKLPEGKYTQHCCIMLYYYTDLFSVEKNPAPVDKLIITCVISSFIECQHVSTILLVVQHCMLSSDVVFPYFLKKITILQCGSILRPNLLVSQHPNVHWSHPPLWKIALAF